MPFSYSDVRQQWQLRELSWPLGAQWSRTSLLPTRWRLHAATFYDRLACTEGSGVWLIVWLQALWRHVVGRQRPGRPHSKWRWCHDIGYPLLAAEHSLCKAPWSGTPCRTTSAHSRTMSPLDSAWKPGFSLATSVLSALETSCNCAVYM